MKIKAQRRMRFEDIPLTWDEYIPIGQFRPDSCGVWHVNPKTDIDSLVFYVNLTSYDREFLLGLRIAVTEI